ncbi:AAA family ATPase [Streptomyces sp. NPDC002519]
MGRAEELVLLASVLSGVRESGAALLLRGDAGVGKTALLQWAEDYAREAGTRVIRAEGAEQESELAFATLHQALYPLLDHMERLPPAQQAALNRAFGALDDEAPDRFAISAAALALLRFASRPHPLLVIVDDTHWIDASSAQVLGFVQRRIAALPVVLLTAARVGWGKPMDLTGVQAVDVAPLPPLEAAALLAREHPHLAIPTAERLLAEAAGNPLALVELPTRLDERQQRGIAPLPSALPLSDRLEDVFAGRVRALPEPARYGLLLAALAGSGAGGLRTVRAAAQGWEGWSEQALQAAVGSGLVSIDFTREAIAFRHPLVRSAVVHVTPPVVRRAGHRALAEVLADQPERQAWHLADAAAGPVEAAAVALEHAADRALGRGGPAEAAAALSRAADLSPTAEGRARRLVEAAFVAVIGGQMELAEGLLETCEREALPADPLRRATAAAYLMFFRDGDLEGVRRTLPPLLDEAYGGEQSEPVLDDALYVLMRACVYLGQADLWEPVIGVLDKGSPHARIGFDAIADPARTAYTVADRLRATVADLPSGLPAWQARWLTLASIHLDFYSEFAEVWVGLTSRSSHAIQQVVTALALYPMFLEGRWDEVEAMAEEAVERARGHGDQFHVGLMSYYLALVATGRGDEERLTVLNARIADWARPQRLNAVLGMVEETNARAALSRGAYEEAYAHASSVTPPGVLPPFFFIFHRVFLDVVEACMRTGRVDEARAHVAAGRQARMDVISPHYAFILAGAAATAAGDEEADQLFQDALSLADRDRWPFEKARIQLNYGEWLRRRHDRRRARQLLNRALSTFRRLGAEPWARRAAEELRAAGAAAPAMALAEGASALTAQELRIAELAAQGKTNKDIGLLLHLSPRTVGAHLYKIYPKLGISSRTALRDALAGGSPPG